MNDIIIKLGLESGMLNYVDNETPRQYFLSGHADEQDLTKFVELIVRECAAYMYATYPNTRYEVNYMRKHMGDSDWNKPIGGE
jgi:hypothetical protein